MRLSTLEMSNWRPFYGKTVLDLTTEPGRPMVWIHGNNMRGKTSVLNAIRWCLYGVTSDSGRERAAHININKDAVDEGDYHMAVRLTFTHSGKEYELERHVQWSARPTSDKGIRENLELRIDHQIQSPGEIHRAISNILHRNISQFYLFDGEMIREFEEILSSDRRQSKFVREAIEQVLGLPALVLAKEDFELLSAETEKLLSKQLRREKRYQQITEELDDIASALGTAKADVERHSELERQLEGQRRALEAVQHQLAQVSSRLRERDVLNDQLRQAKEDLKALTEGVRAALANQWWLPAAQLVEARLLAFEEQRQASSDKESEIRDLERRLAEMESSLARDHCPLCGQPVSHSRSQELSNQAATLQARLQELQTTPDSDQGAMVNPALLREFRNPQATLLREQSGRAGQLQLTIHDLDTRVKRLETGIKESDEADAARTQRDLENVIEKLTTVSDNLGIATRTRDALEAQQRQKRAEITVLPGIADRTRIRLSLFDGLTKVFSTAIDEFRDSVRANVESSASEIFKLFTTEPEFSGVKIDQDYALTILDHSGNPVPPSAGAQQVLALALIRGLNAAAVREGPLVIDSPFARFDLLHRERIIRNLPNVGSQIVLLLQPGEFDRGQYLELAGSSVVREYTVERINDQRSRIRPGYIEDALVG